MADVRIRDLTIEFRSGPYLVRPIHHVDLDLPMGELVLLLGASGCGKTSLLSAFAGILTPKEGTVEVRGHVLRDLTPRQLGRFRRETVGVVFQNFQLVPSLNAWENVAVPLWSARVGRKEAKARALALLEEVGLGERAEHRPSELSGGQQQRVAIARALAHDPPVLLADEPTAHLDGASVEEVLRVLRTLARPDRLVVVATHDHRLLPVADRVIELGGAGPTAPPEPQRIVLDPGEVLFHEGDRGSRIYLVESGSIDLVRGLADGGEEPLATIGAGGYFGELASMLQLPRAATARAASAGTTVVGLTPDQFRKRSSRRTAPASPAKAAKASKVSKAAKQGRAKARSPRKVAGTPAAKVAKAPRRQATTTPTPAKKRPTKRS